MFDVIVIGAGLFGTAAARHLCKKLGKDSEKKIAIIGPIEPKNIELHDGVFSSHYDQSRIVRRLSRDLPWAILTDRSLPEYDEIDRKSVV